MTGRARVREMQVPITAFRCGTRPQWGGGLDYEVHVLMW